MQIAASKSLLALVLVASLWSAASGCFWFHKKLCQAQPDPDPVRAAVCSLPKRRGNGNDDAIRVCYSSKLDTCIYFRYSGCGGNGNNFMTMAECINACHPKYEETDCSYFADKKKKTPQRRPKKKPATKPSRDRVCRLPIRSGTGDQDLVRVAYNPRTDACECFSFSGCGGNDNNFNTMAECEQRCCPRNPSRRDKCRPKLCSLPADSGSCKALRRSFYYDASCDACLVFNYGGCCGNENRFDTKEECERVCKPCI